MNLIISMSDKGVDFNAKVWQYREAGEKDSNEDTEPLDPELDLDALEEDKFTALFSRASSRASSRVGFSRYSLLSNLVTELPSILVI